jgi:hypothetical protein
MSKNHNQDRGPFLARRRFLALGALPLALPTLAGATVPVSDTTTAIQQQAGARRLSVGFWQASADAEELCACAGLTADCRPLDDAGELATVVAAASLSRCEAHLLDRDLRLYLHGLHTVVEPATLEQLTLDVIHRVHGPDGILELPFHAWTYQAGAQATGSSPVGLTTQADPAEGIALRVTTRRADEVEPVTEHYSLATTETGDGMPKLRRGVYFLAGPSRFSGRPPAWNDERYAFRRVDDEGGRHLFRLGTLGWSPVDFDYLILSVEAPAAV